MENVTPESKDVVATNVSSSAIKVLRRAVAVAAAAAAAKTTSVSNNYWGYRLLDLISKIVV